MIGVNLSDRTDRFQQAILPGAIRQQNQSALSIYDK
jgi:hypothetical protein